MFKLQLNYNHENGEYNSLSDDMSQVGGSFLANTHIAYLHNEHQQLYMILLYHNYKISELSINISHHHY